MLARPNAHKLGRMPVESHIIVSNVKYAKMFPTMDFPNDTIRRPLDVANIVILAS